MDVFFRHSFPTVSTASKLKADPTFAGMKARSSGVNEKEGDFESKEEQDLGDVKTKDGKGESSVEAEAAISLVEAESEGSVCDESSSAPNEDEEESEYEEEEESEEDLEGEIGEVDTVPNVGFSQDETSRGEGKRPSACTASV
ncbi:hypothetical protein U1Q18_031043 [Sarracenia purpurea var. burkii]